MPLHYHYPFLSLTLRIPSISNQLLTRTSYLSKPPNLSLSKKPPKMSSDLELILCIFLIAAVFGFCLVLGGLAWAPSKARAGVQSRSAIPGPSGLPIIGLFFAFASSLTLANLAKTFEAVSLSQATQTQPRTFVFGFCLAPGGLAWAPSKARAGVQSRSAIPRPSGLPIIGLVFAFAGSLTLANLAKTFEAVPLMAFSIGFTCFIISSHLDTAKDILSSWAFADRPVKESAYELLFHQAMGFAPYSEYWRNLRRISSTHLFSSKRITCFGNFQQKMGIEMVNQVKGLMEKNGVVEIKRVLHFGSLNNVMMSVFGRSYDFNGCDGFELEGLVSEGYELLGIFNWSDHFPLLGLLDLQGVRKRCRELVSRVNVFVGKIIEEHRFKREKNGGVVGGGDDDDFVDVLLDLENDNKLSDSDMIAVLWGMKSQCDEKMFYFIFCKTRTVSTKILGKMDATKKQLTKPSTATKKVTNYEKQRMKTIHKNRERMNALGVKNITTCLKAVVQHKKLRKEKQIPIDENNDDYRPSEAKDGSDTQFYDSFEYELLEIPSRARSQSHHEALTHASEEGHTSSRPEVASHPPPPLNVEPQLEVTAGNTIGIGVEVRTRLPDPSVHRWKYVDASVKEAMFQRLNDQFDLQGDPVDIEKAMNTKFGRRLSNHTYRLHKQFMELKEAKGEEYARNHPPKNVDPTKWIDLIDKKWNTKEFLRF
ncbi:unnamed protein product [Camellia sinensis]